jgi:hypothetical protein
MIYEYVRSPSLRHIRDGYALNKLAIDIVRSIDRGNSIWRKWDGQREFLLKSCLRCWIPLPALLEALNELPGPKLTKTDVEQRLRQMEEDQSEYAWDRQRDFCLEIYERERLSTGPCDLPLVFHPATTGARWSFTPVGAG